MLKRSFEVFNTDLDMLNLFGAFCFSETKPFFCSLSYEQSRMLPRNRKRNTLLFEQLNEIIGLPYALSHDVLPDFLYECIFVDMNVHESDAALCLLKKDEDNGITAVRPALKEEIIQGLFRCGFTITGVPGRDPHSKKRVPGNAGSIHYRAFVASASMARKGIYLFVNEAHYQALMERLTLGFFSFDAQEKRIVAREALFRKDFRISPSKMSAYLGLMLSDGVCVREAQEAWKKNRATGDVPPPELNLNEKTVFVAHDLMIPASRLYPRNSSHVWVFGEADVPMHEISVCDPEKAGDASLRAFFRALGDPTRRTWDALACTSACLDRWSAIVRAYLHSAKEAQLVWEAPLPPMPADDGQLQRNLHHYAYLLAVLLYQRLCGRPKHGAEAALWRPDDCLDVRIHKCICALQSDADARHTALKLRNSREILSISILQPDGAGDGSADGQPCCAITRPGCRLCIRYAGAAGSKMYEAKLVPAETLDQQINMFDGIGLCAPDTFDKLERLLLRTNRLQEKPRCSALVIRLPWLKGVLVRVDFMRFFREKCAPGALPGTIRDVFDRERELSSIRIIINESMLKGYSYLRNLLDSDRIDPWAYYWEQIRANRYRLLITGRNSPSGSRANINSQFLSTIPLDDDQMDALIRRNIGKLKDFMKDREGRLRFYLRDSAVLPEEAPDGDEGDGSDRNDEGESPSGSIDAESRNTDDTFGAALRSADGSALQGRLLATRYARSSLQSHIRARILNCLQGRLEIKGDYRFVAPDLLCMLHYLKDRYLEYDSTRGKAYFSNEYQPVSAINQFVSADGGDSPDPPGYHGHGFFYAPGPNTPWDEHENRDICALRNPHYALGEGVILTALSGEQAGEYRRWFGQLDSCIQLPATAAGSMGGADFDGDLCLCVAEPSIIEALKRTIAQNGSSLRYILKNRALYLRFLDDQLGKAGDTSSAVCQYLRDIKVWLGTCLPAGDPDSFIVRNPDSYCPPLFFGLNNHGIDFSVSERNIDKYLLDTFLMTTRQQIGLLSIDALNLSQSAYWTGNPHTDESPGDILMQDAAGNFRQSDLMKLRHWLFHWRMVSLALENGAEIDMAKTGVRALAPRLRRPCVIPDEDRFRVIAGLEEHHTSILRIIGKKIKDNPAVSKLGEKDFANALTGMMGEQETNALDSLVRLGEMRRQKPHHNAHLIPCLIYQALFHQDSQASDGSRSAPLLPMPESSGIALRDFFQKHGCRQADAGPAQDDAVSTEESAVASDPHPLATLVWARNDGRPDALSGFIRSAASPASRTADGTPPEASAPVYPDELVRDEQGIYFFKEILKYMYFSSETGISDTLDSSAARTPAALRQKLIDILGEDNLLPFLTQYSYRHYDARSNRYVNDINDFLFLALASDSFVTACEALCGGKSPADGTGASPAEQPAAPQGQPDDQSKAAKAVRAYIQYKAKLAAQAANTEKMKVRYACCLRNLQRRFSLVEAYNIMNRYNRGFSGSPLAGLGIPEDRLRRLYSQLEKREG